MSHTCPRPTPSGSNAMFGDVRAREALEGNRIAAGRDGPKLEA